MSIGWLTEITGDLRMEFLQWIQGLKILVDIHISRWINVTAQNLKCCTIHTFCDTNKEAYAAVIFLRLEEEGSVKLSLLAVKSRIAPLKDSIIPRLELLATLVGARLTHSAVEVLHWKETKCYYWSYSTIVLAWISGEENWSVFVRNRVQEIRKLTSPLEWNNEAGELNPADLPPKGCTATLLLSLRWWDGPHWLTEPLDFSHHENIYSEDLVE
ncbi:integrase catalytic domain-containing protein [Nephila pilipes]|uniref:Integrase catalytic domain-containing protein n=1 Tax=Nephila pilipes TaxID=299642 RepID=A0A8X6PZH3_NEPPI|nr:integrase catalytic domain-containing protein [Nephila pilipes]